jgi:glycosyltransferase involved in cell wall biosynthesis
MPRVYRSNEIVTISQSSASELQARKYDNDRIGIVSPGVDLPEDADRQSRSQTPLIVCLGRLKGYKGVDVLLKAMPAVRDQLPDVRLSIVGQGPERSRLERLAWTLGLAGNVTFHGYLDKAAKEELLSAAWIAVCPSAFEGWGVVCLEANAHGVPVIASAVAGLRDAVIDGETGSLVPFGDTQALAEEIVSLSRDEARRTAMGNAGRTWAASHTWDASADKFLERLKSIAARRGHNVGQPASIPEEASGH